MKRSTLLLGAVCLGVALFTLPQLARGESGALFRDLRPNHWLWNGSDPLTAAAIVNQVRASGSGDGYADLAGTPGAAIWTDGFAALGDRFARLAEEQETLGLDGAAADLYMKAAAAFSLAKYPLIEPTEAQIDAFRRSLDAVHRGYELMGYRVEPVAVPFADGVADGHLLLPPGDRPAGGWPLVIASNGIDVGQGEFFSFGPDLANRGIALLMHDIAGTGTNSEFPLTPDFDAIPALFAETLGASDRFDADRIAVMGVSFGGNAVVKLAHTRPDLIRAAVNVCGPLHDVFQIPHEQFETVGLMYRLALFDRTDIPTDDPTGLLDHMRGFSLVDQGIVVPGGAKTDVPILSVNARDDYVAPEFDMDLANNSTTNGTLIYSGENDHCPQDRFTVMPKIADWLEEQLALEQS